MGGKGNDFDTTTKPQSVSISIVRPYLIDSCFPSENCDLGGGRKKHEYHFKNTMNIINFLPQASQ